MTTRVGRPKSGGGHGTGVHPHIGGKPTLGAKPINGGEVSNTGKAKEGAVRKQSWEAGVETGVGGLSKSKDSFPNGIGFPNHGKPKDGVGGLNRGATKKKRS